MLALRNHFSISDEFLLVKHKKGVKLLPLENIHINHHAIIGSVGDIFKLPYSVYFLDKKDRILGLNEINAHLVGVYSYEDAWGRDFAEFTDEKTAQTVHMNNKEVFKSECMLITEEFAYIDHLDQEIHCLTYKMPLYNTENELLGLFGISSLINSRQTAQSIIDLVNMNLLPSSQSLKKIDCPTNFSLCKTQLKQRDIYAINHRNLTSKQIAILESAMLGKTAKQIGKEHNISSRTVEMHITNLKERFNVSSKSELIQRAFAEYFISDVKS